MVSCSTSVSCLFYPKAISVVVDNSFEVSRTSAEVKVDIVFNANLSLLFTDMTGPRFDSKTEGQVFYGFWIFIHSPTCIHGHALFLKELGLKYHLNYWSSFCDNIQKFGDNVIGCTCIFILFLYKFPMLRKKYYRLSSKEFGEKMLILYKAPALRSDRKRF